MEKKRKSKQDLGNQFLSNKVDNIGQQNSIMISTQIHVQYNDIMRFKPPCIGITRCHVAIALPLRTLFGTVWLGFCLYFASGRHFVMCTQCQESHYFSVLDKTLN